MKNATIWKLRLVGKKTENNAMKNTKLLPQPNETDPTDVMDPTDPTDPTNPTDSTNPTDPTDKGIQRTPRESNGLSETQRI